MTNSTKTSFATFKKFDSITLLFFFFSFYKMHNYMPIANICSTFVTTLKLMFKYYHYICTCSTNDFVFSVKVVETSRTQKFIFFVRVAQSIAVVRRLNVSGQLSVEILKTDYQLTKCRSLVCGHCPTIGHNSEQLIGTIYWLC